MIKQSLEIAIEIAQEAGKVLREEMERPPTIAYKGDFDLVTQADRRSEQVIVTRLQQHFPGHTVAAEEGTGKNTGSEYVWHVDPLDGTTNFAHAYPCFCVSMALARGNELLLGVIYNPIYQELFAAARGEGATFNGRKISCSKITSLKSSLLCTGFPNHNREANPNFHYYWDFTLRSHGVRRDGSAALDLASVAMGRFDSFWEFGLNPWDVAAGIVLVEEAGGKISDMQGKAYRLGGPSILASNGSIHDEMVRVAAEVSGEARTSGSTKNT
ncbi:MAG TPA: inositol monophosphatase family protein [Candidatus Saccharimonadales bacterium]|nr:inositol monophosphatase family protein [Candidatus Saccharimonadales bacterium]